MIPLVTKVRSLRKQREAMRAAARTARPRAQSTESLGGFIARNSPRYWPPPWHLAQLIALFERAVREPVRALVSMPPRHGKSVTAQECIAWATQEFPERLNAYVSYSQRAANPQSRATRRLAAEAGVALADDAAAVHDWRTIANGGLVATGVAGPLTGTGVTGILAIDDPHKDRAQAESQLERDNVWDWFTSVALTRLEPGASCIVIATRWHPDDLIGRLEELGGWSILNLPALRDPATGLPHEDGVPLWPERFPLRFYDEIRAANPYDWASLYQGRPRPRGGKIFENAEPPRFDDRAPDHTRRVVLSVDAAGTENARSNYTAIGALEFEGYGAQTTCSILEVERYQLSPEHSAPRLLAFQERWAEGGAIRIEATRDGKEVARMLRAISPDIEIVEVPPLGDKWTRAQPVAAAWNQGRVRLPRSAPWIKDFLAELAKFTGLGDALDDQVDMLSQGWNEAASAGPTHGVKVVGAPRDEDHARRREDRAARFESERGW